MLTGKALDLVTQTLMSEINSAQKALTDMIATGKARAQEDLHELVDSISAHLNALDILHGNAVAAAQATVQQVEQTAQNAVGQAVGVADQVAADVQKVASSS